MKNKRQAAGSTDLISVESARTLDGLFVQRVRRSPERVAYRHYDRTERNWRDLTWGQMGAEAARWQDALRWERLHRGDRVAILLRNCPEWVQFDQAAMSLGLVTVPLYTDDRPENIAYILEDAAVRVLLIQDAGRWKRLRASLGDRVPLKRVVIFELDKEAQKQQGADSRVVIASDWIPLASPKLRKRVGEPDSLASIVYTSGTTGRPKGVMLSHRNLLSVAHASLSAIQCYQEDLFLSFLPLSHALERTAGYYLPMMAGAVIAFARSVQQLGDDLRVIRPTVLVSVPRVFERVQARIYDDLGKQSALARWVFRLAVRTGWNRFQREQGRGRWKPSMIFWPLLRRMVADKLAAKLGGRIRVAVSGGAALPFEVAQLFLGLGIPVIQGYGLTEASPVVSVNRPEENDPASVGAPLRGIKVRIGEDGELLVKSPGVMLGYWNDHEATSRVIDAKGWLHTGDRVRVERNRIYITGRLKDILVLSNGEKVSPGDMEMAIGGDPLFDQVMVLGEGRAYLSALVVLNADLWRKVAGEIGVDPEAPESLGDPKITKLLIERIRVALREFPGYAKIRRVTPLLEPWTVENGLITPTFKLRRTAVLERHSNAVEAMYADGLASATVD